MEIPIGIPSASSCFPYFLNSDHTPTLFRAVRSFRILVFRSLIRTPRQRREKERIATAASGIAQYLRTRANCMSDRSNSASSKR